MRHSTSKCTNVTKGTSVEQISLMSRVSERATKIIKMRGERQLTNNRLRLFCHGGEQRYNFLSTTATNFLDVTNQCIQYKNSTNLHSRRSWAVGPARAFDFLRNEVFFAFTARGEVRSGQGMGPEV